MVVVKTKRREFIKSLGTLGLGLALPEALQAFSNNEIDTSKRSKLCILQTTDVHCQIHPHDELFWENNQIVFRKTGGYANLAAHMQHISKNYKHCFKVDTGDMFQGSELSVKTTGEAIVPILNALDYNLFLPGNWEVIYGKKKMQALLGALNAPKVCANMYHDLGDGKRGDLIFPPYYIWQAGDIKIGFLGYTDPLVPIRQSPNYSKGIIYTKPEDNIASLVKQLKETEACNFIVILAHLGLSQQIALANNEACAGVNYIMGGDTHERVRTPIACKYAKVVEPGAFGSFIGKLELEFENGVLISESYELLEIDDAALSKNKRVEQLLQKSEKPYLAETTQVIGYSTIPLYRYFVVENPIDTMILNALHWKFPDTDICLSNGFRFCQPQASKDASGNYPITQAYLYDMLPVDSAVRMAKASGLQIREWLEKELNNVFSKDASKRLGGWVVKFKGLEISFKAFSNYGERIESITVRGLALDPAKEYTLLACERDGDPEDMLCRLKGVREGKNSGFTLHQVITDYLKINSPVTPTPPLAAKILDAPATLLSQVSGVDYQFR